LTETIAPDVKKPWSATSAREEPERRAGAGSSQPEDARIFGTEAVRADLRGSSVRSSALVLGTRAAQSVLSLLATMVLARLLTPADFGLIAMVMPVALLLSSISVNGLQTTIIQEDALDQDSASALFRHAAIVNFAAAATVAAVAPALAWFFGEPRVTTLGLAWAAILFGSAVFSFPEALLKRQMRFGVLAALHIGALALGIVVAITAAWTGAGYWALLLQMGVLEIGRGISAWLICDWKPSLHSTGTSPVAARMRSFWFSLAGFRIASWLGEQPDRLLVGRLGGPAALGLYEGARRWSSYALMETFNALSDVAVASFSRLSGDPLRYRTFVRRGLLPVFTVSLPAISFLFVEAELAVRVLLGHQWLDAVPLVRLMCIAFFFASAARVTQWFYFSLGDRHRQFRWALAVNTPLTLLGIAIGYRWGVTGVATGYMIATSVLALPSVAWCLRGAPFSFSDFLRVASVPAIASVFTAAALALIRPLLPEAGNALLDLMMAFAAFAVLLPLMWLLIPGGRAAGASLWLAFADLRRPQARPD
jgi:O-antigen/teichoic acid export membrane protein